RPSAFEERGVGGSDVLAGAAVPRDEAFGEANEMSVLLGSLGHRSLDEQDRLFSACWKPDVGERDAKRVHVEASNTHKDDAGSDEPARWSCDLSAEPARDG